MYPLATCQFNHPNKMAGMRNDGSRKTIVKTAMTAEMTNPTKYRKELTMAPSMTSTSLLNLLTILPDGVLSSHRDVAPIVAVSIEAKSRLEPWSEPLKEKMADATIVMADATWMAKKTRMYGNGETLAGGRDDADKSGPADLIGPVKAKNLKSEE